MDKTKLQLNSTIQGEKSRNFAKLYIAVNQFYLNKFENEPHISDEEYDLLVKEFEAKGGSVKNLVEWDSDLRFQNEPISNVSKIVVADNDLRKAAKEYIESSNEIKNSRTNLKYDGASIKAYYKNGKLKMILGTPDESFGIIRTKTFWDLFPHELKDKSIKSLQGEVLVDCEVYGQLARNKANGLTNSKLMDSEVENEAFIRVYRVQFHDNQEFDYYRQIKALNDLEPIFKSRLRKCSKDEPELEIKDKVFAVAPSYMEDELPKDSLYFSEDGNFQVDGVVVYSNIGIQIFKFYFTESAITTVQSINYGLQPNGSYSATIHFTPIVLNEKNISCASSGGIRNMMEMGFGVGATIKVILSGTTIPKIVEVINRSDDYKFPICGCGHQLTKEDIFGSVLKCTNIGICSTKVNLWKNEYKNSIPKSDDVKDSWEKWLKNNFLTWMIWFKIDRWDPSKNLNYSKDSTEYQELIDKIIYSIKTNQSPLFIQLIQRMFRFSDLQLSNFKINVKSLFQVMLELTNETTD